MTSREKVGLGRREVEDAIQWTRTQPVESLSEISSEVILPRAVLLIDSLWMHYSNEFDLRCVAAAISRLLQHDAVWDAVRSDCIRYIAMLRSYDSWPFTPNAITVLKDGPYRQQSEAFLKMLLARGPGMEAQDVRDALAGVLAKA